MNKPYISSVYHRGQIMKSDNRKHHNGSCSFWKAFMDEMFEGWEE